MWQKESKRLFGKRKLAGFRKLVSGVSGIRLVSIATGLIFVLIVSLLFNVYSESSSQLLVLGIILSTLLTLILNLTLTVDRRISSIEELSSRISENENLRDFYNYTVPPLEDALECPDWGRMSIVDTKAFMLLLTHCSISGHRPPETEIPILPDIGPGYKRSRSIPVVPLPVQRNGPPRGALLGELHPQFLPQCGRHVQ